MIKQTWQQFAKDFGTVLSTDSTDEFPEVLINWINQYVRADNCAIFQVVPGDPLSISHLFTCGRLSRKVSDKLAEDYVNKYGLSDPNLRHVKRETEHFITLLRRPAIEAYDDQYQAKLFATPHLIDKVSALQRTQYGYIYLNLYRTDDSGAFSESDHELLNLIAPMAASAVVSRSTLHSIPSTTTGVSDIISDRVTLNSRAPFDQLTNREKEVCERILKGLSAEGISLDLGIAQSSVSTYRKRAYSRLEISTQNELFRLFLSPPATHR